MSKKLIIEEISRIQEILKNNKLIVEQDWMPTIEKIIQFADEKVTKYLDELLPKLEKTLSGRLDKYIEICSKNGEKGLKDLKMLVLQIAEINISYAKEFTKTWDDRLFEFFKVGNKTREEGLNSIEKTFGKNIRNEFEKLHPVENPLETEIKNRIENYTTYDFYQAEKTFSNPTNEIKTKIIQFFQEVFGDALKESMVHYTELFTKEQNKEI
jgi:hypothetical protein